MSPAALKAAFWALNVRHQPAPPPVEIRTFEYVPRQPPRRQDLRDQVPGRGERPSCLRSAGSPPRGDTVVRAVLHPAGPSSGAQAQRRRRSRGRAYSPSRSSDGRKTPTTTTPGRSLKRAQKGAGRPTKAEQLHRRPAQRALSATDPVVPLNTSHKFWLSSVSS